VKEWDVDDLLMKKLQLLLNQLESYIPDFEKTNSVVSNSTVGWQIDHSLLVVISIINQLKNSNPDTYKWKFNFWRNIIMIVNTIPRGKIKVPKSVTPVDIAKIEELKTKLEITRKNLDELRILPAKSLPSGL
jgi:hypothetical protein